MTTHRSSRARAVAALAACALGAATLTVALGTASSAHDRPHPGSGSGHGGGHGGRDLGREVLAPGDGWASAGTGTTGGSGADAAHVFRVSTWPELRAALGGAGARGDTTPRIVYVEGALHAGDTADGRRLACGDYEAQAGFSMADYIAAFDPAVWGAADPSGPLEDARVAAAAVQATQTQQHVGSNVTIVGVGKDASITGANLRIRDSHNVIVRNLHLSDAYDCFPAWDPGDGSAGSWNSAYDNLTLWTSTNVWVDHTTLDDGDNPPSSLPVVYGRPFEVHDGLLDITHGSDLVTVSYNRFDNHDKTMLIGSSDSRTQDRGLHRVTIHHNRWTDVGQRAPRVRYGQVHVYNNHYVQTTPGLFQYHWGVGVESAIVAQNNAFTLADGVTPDRILVAWKGTALTESGSIVNRRPTDVLAAFNAVNDPDLGADAGWTPTLVPRLDPTWSVAKTVDKEAGAGNIRKH